MLFESLNPTNLLKSPKNRYQEEYSSQIYIGQYYDI